MFIQIFRPLKSTGGLQFELIVQCPLRGFGDVNPSRQTSSFHVVCQGNVVTHNVELPFLEPENSAVSFT